MSRYRGGWPAALVVAAWVGLGIGAAGAQTPVRIGVLTDMSSLYSDSGGKGSVQAARLAVQDFGGRVLDRPIEVLFADHQNKADIGANIARGWYDTDGVLAIVDVPNSSVALAIQQLTRDKDKVFLISAGGSSDLTGPACSPNGIHWTYDTYAMANGTARGLVQQGYKTWFFITADYAFGQALERDATAEILRDGGKVLGSVRAPLNTADFSSYLLQAQASKAQVVALANAGGDTVAAIKQAAEFGLRDSGQILAGLLVNVDDVHSLGLPVAQGLLLTNAFYWDDNDGTRAFAKRFFETEKRMPSMYQAGVYSAVLHYLKAMTAAGTDQAKPVIAKMKEMPVDDFFAPGGRIRADGRMIHSMYVRQVKTPKESKGEWDVYKLVQTLPADQAFRPMADGGCPLVK